MHHPQHIKIAKWSDFEGDLRRRLESIRFKRMILIRNYNADRANIALETGTDRDINSEVWSATHFDHDHNGSTVRKQPHELVYVHRLNWLSRPFTVLNLGDEFTESFEDLTEPLSDCDAISVYDSAGLERVAFNEHWFTRNPREALLYVYSIEPDEDD